MFLKKIGIRSIRIIILIRILNKAINKKPIIIIMFKRNQFFLINKMIYIIYIRNLHNFLK